MEKKIFESHSAADQHNLPFSDFPFNTNDHDLSDEFLKKWVLPHYLEITSYGDEGWEDRVKKVKHEITEDVCRSLLGTSHWEMSVVGTYFTAVKGYRNFVDLIGTKLLNVDSIMETWMDALVLVFFNDATSVGYLHRFLDLYLTMPLLDVDQESAMNAVLYLDRENNTNYFPGYLEKWKVFKKIQTTTHWEQAEPEIRRVEKK